jgi:hypothetical protein
MVVRTRGHPLSFQDIYLVPRSSPFIYRPTSSAASSPRSAPSGPLVIGPGVGRPSRGRPPTGQIWVWRNIWVWRKSSSRCPTQHPAHADGPPPPLLPAPPSASRPRRPPLNRQLAGCPSGLADRHPTAPPPPRLEGRCRTPSTPPRGEGTPARSRHRASRLARAVTSDRPIAPSPAAYGAPPQSTSQPGAAGPVASRLTIYSPTPVGWGNGQQALKSPKNLPGDTLNYVTDPCTIVFPYKVGHPLSPVTQFKGLSQNPPVFT